MNFLMQAQPAWLLQLRRFALSWQGIAAQAALAGLMVLLGTEVAGIAIFIVLFCAFAVLCDNLLATATPFLLPCLFLIQTQNTTALDRFLPFAWLVAIPVAAMLFHLWRYRVKLTMGRATWAWFAVSIATMLGGLGYISAAEYFAALTIYHVLALGFGMLAAYVWLSSAIAQSSTNELPRFFSNLMVSLGLVASFMVVHYYLVHLLKGGSLEVLEFQWRNNVSSFLMLSLPFSFFKALQRPAWLLAAMAMFASMLLSGSRGGLLFGSVLLAGCILFLVLADKKRRKYYIIALVAASIGLVLTLRQWLPFFVPTLRRTLDSLRHGNEDARALIWQRGWEDFLRRPLLGTGLGYMGNRDVHPSLPGALCWYHNSAIQIIGSMGIAGVLAYGYMYIMRFVIFLRQRSTFHYTLLLSWLGIEMMSLVNPGVFAPIPYLLVVVMLMVMAEKYTKTK